jgi:hypothetical protein
MHTVVADGSVVLRRARGPEVPSKIADLGVDTGPAESVARRNNCRQRRVKRLILRRHERRVRLVEQTTEYLATRFVVAVRPFCFHHGRRPSWS